MSGKMRFFVPLAMLAAMAFVAAGCTPGPEEKVVVVYTALDDLYSRPILERFERETGIRVLASYDTELTKTTGLVNRIIAEAANPRADVFWSNEIARTIVLDRKGLLAPCDPPTRKALPAIYKRPNWTGFAARARVIVYNTEILKADEAPQRVAEFVEPRWKGRLAIANPLFGTTATHAALLFERWGEEKARGFFQAMRRNGVAVLAGNATVKDRVAAGEFAAGLTDTDDVMLAIQAGKPVGLIYPDQENEGTVLIPNTVALLKGAPHAECGRKLVEFLLRPETELELARLPGRQIPLHPGLPLPQGVMPIERLRVMEVNYEAVAQRMEDVARYVKEHFLD